MKTLLCSVPDGSLNNTLTALVPRGNCTIQHISSSTEYTPLFFGVWDPISPLGILRLMTWMEKNGHSSDLYDINNLRPSDEQLIKTFKQINPTVVGLSATLSHCYPNIKRITKSTTSNATS